MVYIYVVCTGETQLHIQSELCVTIAAPPPFDPRPALEPWWCGQEIRTHNMAIYSTWNLTARWRQRTRIEWISSDNSHDTLFNGPLDVNVLATFMRQQTHTGSIQCLISQMQTVDYRILCLHCVGPVILVVTFAINWISGISVIVPVVCRHTVSWTLLLYFGLSARDA